MAASWIGVAGRAVVKSENIAWDGTEWESLGDASGPWTRTGTSLAPHTAGDVVTVSAGTEALPGLTPVGDPNTGLWAPAADTLALSVKGGEALRIDDQKRVGIGTTSPGTLLHIASSSVDPEIRLVRDPGSGNINSVKSDFYDLSVTSGRNFIINAGGSERARIDSSGRLLVGTSSARSNFFRPFGATAVLQVEGTSGNSATSSVVRNSNDSSPSYLVLGKSRSTVNASNTIVQANDSIGAISFQGTDGGDLTEAARITAEVDGTPGTADMPGRLVFSTADGASSPTERMRITKDGELLIATTAFSGVGISINSPELSGCYATSSGTGNRNIWRFANANGVVGAIQTSASATIYATSSDYRLKENVTAVTDGITRLQQLKPSRFNFIADPDHTVDGFIAHEAQAVVPECVTGEKDVVDDDGNPVYQGIDQSKLVPLLTAALQEAIAKIETLEARLSALESA
jgi:hypothetical protein